MKRLLLVFMALSAPCFAANTAILPNKPEPQYQGKVHAADREFWIEAGALGTAWTLDAVSTHQAFAAGPHRSEAGMFFKGSRSVLEIMGAWAAVDIGAAVTAYEWKKHVRNRYLHPLWRIPMLVGAIGHDQAAIGNWTLSNPPIVPEAVSSLPGPEDLPHSAPYVPGPRSLPRDPRHH